MLTTSLLLALAMAADASGTTADPYLPVCHITLIADQPVPASDAGKLTVLNVTEGSRVKKDQVIGLVDDAEAQATLQVAQAAYDAAQQTADSDIDIRHAEMAARVAQKVHEKLKASNEAFTGTVTAIDILRAELEFKRTVLAIQQAKEDNIEAKWNAKAKFAELGVAKVALERRKLRAPFDGIVVAVHRHPGEWVAPGDPVVEIVDVTRLRVEGSLDANEWSPADIENRKVTVEVTLPLGKKVKADGRITFVSPEVKSGELDVIAEIHPRVVGNLPLVRAGLPAAMTIHASQPVAAAPQPATRATPVGRSTARPPRKK